MPAPEDNGPIFVVGLAALGLVVIAYSIVTILGITRSSQLTQADNRIAQINGQIKSDRTLSDTLEKYNSIAAANENLLRILNSRFLFLPGWKAVKTSVPKDMQFTSVSVSNDLTYRVSGETKSVASLATFSKVLEGKLGAKSVVPSSINKKTDTDRYTFGISFDLIKTEQTQ
jgi:hypothetical protein